MTNPTIEPAFYFPEDALAKAASRTRSDFGGLATAIGLLNYNGTSYTLDCLQSITKDAPERTVVMILENGSRPDPKRQLVQDLTGDPDWRQISKDIITDRFGSTIDVHVGTMRGMPVIVLDHPRNMGFCTGYNMLVEVAERLGCWSFFVLNNDTLLHAGAVARLVETLDSNPSAAVVSPIILDADGDRWYEGGWWSPWEYHYYPDRRRGREPSDPKARNDGPYATALYSGCCALFRISTYRELGGMYDPIFICFDEPEFSRRLLAAGHRILVEPRASITHLVSKTLDTDPKPLLQYFWYRNAFVYSNAHNGSMQSLRVYARRLGGQFMQIVRRNTSAPVTAKWAGGAVVAMGDHLRGIIGPGRWWRELNAFPPNHPAWRPQPQWRRAPKTPFRKFVP